ncbi:MAG: hypothetical protein VXA08_04215, partial [Alphaproteobacteria bacterium]
RAPLGATISGGRLVGSVMGIPLYEILRTVVAPARLTQSGRQRTLPVCFGAYSGFFAATDEN